MFCHLHSWNISEVYKSLQSPTHLTFLPVKLVFVEFEDCLCFIHWNASAYEPTLLADPLLCDIQGRNSEHHTNVSPSDATLAPDCKLSTPHRRDNNLSAHRDPHMGCVLVQVCQSSAEKLSTPQCQWLLDTHAQKHSGNIVWYPTWLANVAHSSCVKSQ